jgi:hypothetical protein
MARPPLKGGARHVPRALRCEEINFAARFDCFPGTKEDTALKYGAACSRAQTETEGVL